MFVLGIDPGLSRCGYAVLSPRKGGRARAHAIGVITTPPAAPTPERLAELQRELRALMADYDPAVVAVERLFLQNNLRTAIGVAQAAGLALCEAAARRAVVAEYSPTEIKAAVAGDGRADKEMMIEMVQHLLELPVRPKPADAADAAAVALCHLAHDPHGRSVQELVDAGADRAVRLGQFGVNR